MKFNFGKSLAVAAVLGLGTTGTIVPTLRSALAQGVTRADIYGSWTARNGDRYVFKPGGTYTFSVGKRASGNISHSGSWSLERHGLRLRLHSTRRVVLEGRHPRTLNADKVFLLTINFKSYEAGELYIGGKEFDH